MEVWEFDFQKWPATTGVPSSIVLGTKTAVWETPKSWIGVKSRGLVFCRFQKIDLVAKMVNLKKRRYVVNEDLKWHKLSGSIIDLDRLRSPMEALISIAGKTMVAHTISALRRLGVNEFYICRGWKGAVAAVVAPGGSNVGRIKDYDWGMKIVNDLSLNSGVFEFGNNWIEWLLWRDRFGEKYFKTLAQQTQKGEWVWCTCNWILETFWKGIDFQLLFESLSCWPGNEVMFLRNTWMSLVRVFIWHLVWRSASSKS